MTDGLTPGAADLPMAAFLDDFLRHAPWRICAVLRLATWVVEFSPILLLQRPLPFTKLGQAEREASLARLGASPLHLVRELPLLLKMVACMGFCGHPEARRQIGIPTAGEAPAWATAAEEG